MINENKQKTIGEDIKYTILNLKKKVLVIESDNGEIPVFTEFDKIKFICKGSEITEEIASGIVEKAYYKNTFVNYNRGFDSINHFNSALESFKSAIKSKSFMWLDNGLNEQENTIGEIKSIQWQEAEEKTFRNCIIFEIL